MIQKPLYEIIQEAADQPVLFDKVQVLRQYDSKPLRSLLKHAIDPEIKFLPCVKEGVEYKPNIIPGHETTFYSRVRLLYLFVEGTKPIDPKITKNVLAELLESIDHRDAEFLLQVIKKKLPKGLNKQIVQQAFPGIVNEQVS